MSQIAIPGYRLRLPDRQDVLAALSKLLDDRAAYRVWAQACDALHLPFDLPTFTPDQLQRLASWLTAQDSLARVVGCSLQVRVIAYRQLSNISHLPNTDTPSAPRANPPRVLSDLDDPTPASSQSPATPPTR